MKIKSTLTFTGVLVLYSIGLTTVCAHAAPVVWVAPSLQRISPTDSAGSETQARLWAARGEYESFQIVTRAPKGSILADVRVEVSDLTGPNGHVIPKSDLTLYREHYVYIGPENTSPDWEGSNRPLGAGWYPDGLIPFANPANGAKPHGQLTAVPYDVAAGKNQPIWADVFVPRTAAPGLYVGTYTVTSNQGDMTGQIELNVWSFTMPVRPSLSSSFGVWTSFDVATYQELLRNRIMPDYGDSDLTARQETSLTDQGLGAVDLGFFSGASYGDCHMSAAPSVNSIKSAAASHAPGVLLYNFSADEIDDCTNQYSTIKKWARNLHTAGIKNLATMAPVPELFDDGSGTGRSAVDIWVIEPDLYRDHASDINIAREKGDQIWSYNTEVQDAYSPKWEIDFAPINFRIQPGFINQSLGMTGLLYWSVDNWSSDPWNKVVMNDGGDSFPGDGALVYPGSTVGVAGVVPSMRLKWLRDGVDDYDYIQMLKQAGYGDFALQIAKTVGADFRNWTHDPDTLQAARQKLGQTLDSLAK